ncbi:hypothetical protein AMS68_007820 [Peltaster fructicola]|uniref:Uncharacterized protein n=1 Tax=Peltaster fructicola TaxID=286661 RepID=A0A6H0Y5M4_9PEZI|nr:hypothetical protein AMS68_007820 [Peltaster fructicola]
MILLNVYSHTLTEFSDARARPDYAILSHRWTNDEVLYSDIQSGRAAAKTTGFAKLKACSALVKQEGLQWIWCDTYCIDKTSSAALSESINSMYAWYAAAKVCYAYIYDQDKTVFLEGKQKSTWFARGWTLQELLAPKRLSLYDKHWSLIGTRQGQRQIISHFTRIPESMLLDVPSRSLSSLSIAQRMSWAASREVTKAEDIAYCLMGLFDVNMALLYGEGAVKAFHRLQEHIMLRSTDQSIFAWTQSDASPSAYHGLMADHPSAFGNVRLSDTEKLHQDQESYHITNRGLSIHLELHPVQGQHNLFHALLPDVAHHDEDDNLHPTGFLLQKLGYDVQQYARVCCNQLISGWPYVGFEQDPTLVYVRQDVNDFTIDGGTPRCLVLRKLVLSPEYLLLSARTRSTYSGPGVSLLPLEEYPFLGPRGSQADLSSKPRTLSMKLTFGYAPETSSLITIFVGPLLDKELGPVFTVLEDTDGESQKKILEADHEWTSKAESDAVFFKPGTTHVVGAHRVTVEVQRIPDMPRCLYALDICLESADE